MARGKETIMKHFDAFGDIRRACALLTRLPVKAQFSGGAPAAWVWAFPLVGLLISGLAVAVAYGVQSAGLPVGAVAIGLVLQVMLSGAMHEDGLADTSDGLWGGWTPERRLEIMKDSHIGTYGVIALVLAFLWRWSLWSALIWLAPLAIVAAAALSRAAMPVVMAALPHAREGGLSHATGRPPRPAVAAGAVLAAVIAVLCVGIPAALLAIGAAGAAALGVALIARAKIGGQTGDILGAVQIVAELACLTALVTWLAA